MSCENGPKKQNETVPSNIPHLSKKKIWAFRLTAFIIIPLVLLMTLELALLAIGYGHKTSAIIKTNINGRQICHPNLEFGKRFFPKAISNVELMSFAFDPEKSPQTYRIFVMGASAAAGIPDPLYNFGRFLEIMLQDRYPQTKFEVVTVAIPAANSHAVLPIVKDCAQYDPDLFIVYLGNNEVVGPFGAGAVFSPLTTPRLSLIRANLAAKATKTGQLLEALVRSFGSKNDKKIDRGEMDMFLERQVRHDSEGLKQVYSHYENNLKDIIKAGRKADAKVIVSNVGCNLKDNPPFASQHQDGLASSEKQVWEGKYQEGIACETADQFEQAIEYYLAAEQIDGSFADLQFRLGRCYWQLGQFQKAKKRYTLAREYDTLRFRPDTQINTIIETVAAQRNDEGVYFVDAVKALEANSPHNTPGNELFYEHVHYRFEGNYILAHTMFEKIEIILPDNIKQQKRDRPTLSLKQCKDRFVYTIFEEFRIAYDVRHNFVDEPPFTNQLYHIDRINEHEKNVERLKAYKETPYLNEIVSQYKQRILENPTDWRLHYKLAIFLLDGRKELEPALDEFKKVVTFLPDISSYTGIVQILKKQDKLDELARYYEQLLKISPGRWAAYDDYAEVLRKKGDHKNAVNIYEKSRYLFPSAGLDLYILLADSYNKSGNPKKALRVIRKALISADKKMPFDTVLFFSLLQDLDQTQLAIDHYKQVLEVSPDVLPILSELSWFLAAHPDKNIRDPASAVQYAQRACELTGYENIPSLNNLALAYAAAGDFHLAITNAEEAAALAKQRGRKLLGQATHDRLRLYRSGKRYIDPRLQ